MPLIPWRRRPRRASMTVVEHLDELRKRLIISLASISVAAVVGFVFFEPIFGFLIRPYRQAVLLLPLAERPPGAFAEGDLIYSSPVDPFLTFLKVGFFSGLLIALPVVLYQLWRFITPGLTKRERRLAIPFVGSSVLLFAGGVAFAYLTIPRGLSFLLSFGSENLIPLLTVDRYFSFLIFLVLGFGLSFEFPLVMIFLAAARVVSTTQMRKWRRYVYFGALVFAAVITPTQDPYTML
ncbi:MAG: twin-arginine translocase subunit TatC, partial [Actinomycetota bacterium]